MFTKLTQTDCVTIRKDDNFLCEFLPEGLEREESVWKNVVRKIANATNNCLKAMLHEAIFLATCNATMTN